MRRIRVVEVRAGMGVRAGYGKDGGCSLMGHGLRAEPLRRLGGVGACCGGCGCMLGDVMRCVGHAKSRSMQAILTRPDTGSHQTDRDTHRRSLHSDAPKDHNSDDRLSVPIPHHTPRPTCTHTHAHVKKKANPHAQSHDPLLDAAVRGAGTYYHPVVLLALRQRLKVHLPVHCSIATGTPVRRETSSLPKAS